MKVAVLGAGVMGGQIAAHFINARIHTKLYDLAGTPDPNSIVQMAVQNLLKAKPAPFATPDYASLLEIRNYQDHLAELSECDLIIEAVAERIDIKEKLYQQITPHLNSHAIITSNTSGLSINEMAKTLPLQFQDRFCGVHFFNPPRYMPLVELIPTSHTSTVVLDQLETLLVTDLGKSVIRAKDTPNFIANRVGVFSLLAIIHRAQSMNIPFDTVDALTGTLLGRPKSATFRTLDVIGLDTSVHAIHTMAAGLPEDPWHSYYKLPDWADALLAQGALGQKTQKGIYQKRADGIFVYDPASKDYRLSNPQADADVVAILKGNPLPQALQILSTHASPQAKFLWAYTLDLMQYVAVHFEDIADRITDIDEAMQWGFGWAQGPFALWQQMGFTEFRTSLTTAIEAQQTLSPAPLPKWVMSADKLSFENTRSLPVYQRQIKPLAKTLFENESVRLADLGEGVAALSFKTKHHVIDSRVVAGVMQALAVAAEQARAVVIWQEGPDFTFGANLKEFTEGMAKGDFAGLTLAVENFQNMCLAIQRSPIPVVAALQGRCFGGGVEIVMHCAKVVACMETYMGLVEMGVGLIPAGGGSKEFVKRSKTEKELYRAFETIGLAKVSTSAIEAKHLGYLRDSDVVVMNPRELIYIAKQQAIALAESVYHPPLERTFKIFGQTSLPNFQMALVNMREGHQISDYDYYLSMSLARVLSGGELPQGSVVDEAWLLKLERDTFVELAMQRATQARIVHMLKTGSPLRN